MAESPVSLTSEEQALGYKLVQPPASTARPEPPFWVQLQPDPVELAAEDIVNNAWPVALLRELIQQLGMKPVGRLRADLARQYMQLLLDPARLQQALAGLTDEEHEFYVTLLFNLQMQTWRPRPDGLVILRRLQTPLEQLLQRFADLGLGVWQNDGLSLPPRFLGGLPSLSLPLESYRYRKDLRSALAHGAVAEPHRLILRVQQLLSLIQAGTYTLRPRRQWQPPVSGYAAFLTGVTPTPAAAHQLQKAPAPQTVIPLLAPDPVPDDAALTAWSAALGMPPAGVEFLYHLLVAAHLLLPGSPIKVDPYVQQFMARSAGEQAVLLWLAYSLILNWEAFWHRWQAGHIRVHWNYRPYWGVTPYESTLARALNALRNAVLTFLSFLPQETWLSVDAVYDTLKVFLPNMKGMASADVLGFEGSNGSWELFLRIYLEEMLQGPLHWLGAADIAPAAGALQTFQLHWVQDVFWERSRAISLPELRWGGAQAVRYLPEEAVFLLTPPLPPEFLNQLQRWAEPDGLQGSDMRYALQPRRLHQAFEAGETPDSLARQWTAAAGFPPPAALQEWWQLWWHRYGHVRLYPHQAVLTLQDDFALQELQLAVPELRDALLGLVNPRVALLRPDQAEAIFKTMQAKGYLPKEER